MTGDPVRAERPAVLTQAAGEDPIGGDGRDLPAELDEALREGPFHRALRAAIAHRGLPLARLRARLDELGAHVGQSTLSYWQRGTRHPELPKAVGAIRALESVLRLPRESLVTLARLAGRPAGPAPLLPATPADPADAWARTVALLAEFDSLPDAKRCNAELEVLAVHDTVLVGANRQRLAVTTRMVVRALVDGPDRYLVVHHADEVPAGEDIEAVAAEGCRPGWLRRAAAVPGLVAELLFDRRLAEGETHVFCFTVRDGTGGPTPGQYRMFRGSCASYLVQMSFRPEMPPARCVRRFRAADGTEPASADDLVCGLGGVVSAYFPDVGPGLAGIDITWSREHSAAAHVSGQSG
ncbi:hypothetical protein [Gandjariella thermophila]|uniref:Uncharacterized protein n=1 Tax=Gandjariella thermophila TaxID=1931992 RepID=A0A4D4JA26_9PSEU|nr:hypothetical protein [Gandjariella thermophila]GDY31296.1 hypothetical protein GTS_29290 [Gandjariella thermophila]